MTDLQASKTVQTSKKSSNEISLLDLLQIVADNLRLLTLGPLTVGVTALIISLALPPTYTATAKIKGKTTSEATSLKNPSEQYLAFLKSRSIADAVIERFKLQERYDEKYQDDIVKHLGKQVRINSGKDGLITIEADDKEAAFAAELANAHVGELERLMSRLAITETQQRRLFFEKQLQQVKQKLTQAEQSLQASGIHAEALDDKPQAAVAALAQLQAQVTSQEIKISAMRGYMTENSPLLKEAMNELLSLRAQLSKAESNRRDSKSDHAARYHEFKYQEALFDLFSQQYEQAKVDEALEGSMIQVLDLAQAPAHKSKPKSLLIAALASLGSGFALLMFVFIRQGIRNAKQSPETAAKLARLKSSLTFKK